MTMVPGQLHSQSGTSAQSRQHACVPVYQSECPTCMGPPVYPGVPGIGGMVLRGAVSGGGSTVLMYPFGGPVLKLKGVNRYVHVLWCTLNGRYGFTRYDE